MDGLRTAALQAFEQRTLDHLQQYFPRHYALLGEAQLRVVIRCGLSKATDYGLASECCVLSYIDLMCVLGSRFDVDPLLPWAMATLTSQTEPLHEIERGDLLYDQAWRYIRAIVPDYRGSDGAPTTERFVPHLRRLRQLPLDRLSTHGLARYTSELSNWIMTVFPAKSAYVGSQLVAGLALRAIKLGEPYGIRTERGVTLLAVCLFVLGAGFACDPMLPWAERILADVDIPDEPTRIDRLYAEAVHFLKAWWALAPAQRA